MLSNTIQKIHTVQPSVKTNLWLNLVKPSTFPRLFKAEIKPSLHEMSFDFKLQFQESDANLHCEEDRSAFLLSKRTSHRKYYPENHL